MAIQRNTVFINSVLIILYFPLITAISNSTWPDSLDFAEVQFWTYITDNGRVILPWISLPGYRSAPLCYDEAPTRWENNAKMAHLICRQKGSMVATRWYSISKNTVKANVTGLVNSARCHGNEQMIGHCFWNQPIYWPCTDFLAIECGECSSVIDAHEDSTTSIASPGYPVYVPLTTCEWNITLQPHYNAVLKFRQFDLPGPVYDEVRDQMICRYAFLDVLFYREDVGKLILEGRYCGRHSPGILTLVSSQVILRYSAGTFQQHLNSRKGFLLECSVVRSEEQDSQHVLISRWILIGCGIFFLLMIIILLLICKRKICRIPWPCLQLYRADTRTDFIPLSSNPHRIALSYSPSCSRQRRQTVFRTIRANSSHCQKARQLENWKVKRKDSNQINEVAVQTTDLIDSHIYEDIEISPKNVVNSIAAKTPAKTDTASGMSLTNRKTNGTSNLQNEDSPTFQNSILLEHPMHRINSETSYNYVVSNTSLRPPSYNQALHVSGCSPRSCSSAGIYIDPISDE